MVYIFQSRATGNLPVSAATGRLVLTSIGHEITPKGVITVEQLPSAIQALVALCRESSPECTREEGPSDGVAHDAIREHIEPVIDMFEQSLAADKAVTWGA